MIFYNSEIDTDKLFQILFYVFLILSIASSLFPRLVGKREFTVNSIILWVVTFIVVVVAYNYRHVVVNSPVFAQFFPAKGIVTSANLIIYKKAYDGHFYIDTTINNKKLRFLVDTGASDVIISLEDAKFLGYDVSNLNFTKTYITANGKVSAAPIVIKQLWLADGAVVVQDVKAAVTLGKQSGSLLGISFLERFNRYSFSGDDLTIKPH